jgi:hypothetical protein
LCWMGAAMPGSVGLDLPHAMLESGPQHQIRRMTDTTRIAHCAEQLLRLMPHLAFNPAPAPPSPSPRALLPRAGASPAASACPNASPGPNPSSSTPAATTTAAAAPSSSPSRSACGCRGGAVARPTTQRQCKAQAYVHKPAEPRYALISKFRIVASPILDSSKECLGIAVKPHSKA